MKQPPSVEYTLLEPLIEGSDGEQEVNYKQLARKAPNANRSETCGRMRFFLLGLFAFFLVYVSLSSARETLPQIVVKLPPDDVNGKCSCVASLFVG